MSLFLALLLDAVVGEPEEIWKRIKHPAVLMGEAVAKLESRLNAPPKQRQEGMKAVAILVVGFGLLGFIISILPFSWIFETIIAAILLAHKSLVDHVQAVADGLGISVEKGREAVAEIVGRDVEQMDTHAVGRAAIESAAENLSDGVVAPVFWFMILGLPGILIYKAINTADSMIGYKTERLREFGWATAKLDDLLNWIPARITAFLILVCDNRHDDWHLVNKYAPTHRSPNAGWPEAAMAVVIDTPLSGPRVYEGKIHDEPWIHPKGIRDPDVEAIEDSCVILWRVWKIVVGAAFVFGLLTSVTL